jgi:alkylation response protein AidB-like acyl-CoA dehydrogenase
LKEGNVSGFGFSEEQEMFRREVRNFAQRELAPGAKERAKQEGEPEIAHEWAKKIADAGLCGLGVPPKYGGQGADWVAIGIAVEEMSKADMNLGGTPVLPALVTRAMALGGCSEGLQQKYLPAMAKGEFLVCLVISEPHCGSDAAEIKTRATRDGDYYIINGMMGTFDVLRVFLALSVLGGAQTSLEDAITYAKQRTAFGQPIARFEGVSVKIAEHATWIEAARMLCYRTLWLADQELPHGKEAAMSKWLCPVVAVNAIHDSLLIHGHVGYREEYPIEQRLRDAIGYEMADGTAQIMKMIVARELMGREILPY